MLAALGQQAAEKSVILKVYLLNFLLFSIFSYVLINIHEYQNKIICMLVKRLCLSINLEPSLAISGHWHLRYELFSRYYSINFIFGDFSIITNVFINIHGY